MDKPAKVPVHVIWLAQDDPKKNTAVKLSKRGTLKLHDKFTKLPRRGIILEPLCGKVLGPEDHSLLLEEGGSLVGLDCSWAQIEDSVQKVMKRLDLNHECYRYCWPQILLIGGSQVN